MHQATPLLALPLALGYDRPMPGETDSREAASDLLHAAATGGSQDAVRLTELLLGELREIAVRAMDRERKDHTLQPTALVNEVWLRLFEPNKVTFSDRQHFLALCAQVVRQVLVDHARARKRVKRGGQWQRVPLDVEQARLPSSDEESFDLLALDQALDELGDLAPRQARVVELRFFGGLSVEETAVAMQLSESTIAREWRFARAWLSTRLNSP